jgi:hypothetical protein
MAHKVAILFGAGASKGAGYVTPCIPPVMNELFDRLAKHFPQEWGRRSPYWVHAEKFKQDFEGTFSEVVLKQYKDDSLPRITLPTLSILENQRNLALYFSRFDLDSSGRDLYSRLLSFLLEGGLIEHSTFGSLNYDCLFDQAIQRLGLLIDYSCGETEPKTIRVAKVHGSCNFVTETIDENMRAQLASPGIRYERKVIFLPPVNVEKSLKDRIVGLEPAHLPIMSQISPAKEDLLAPSQVQQCRNRWRDAVLNASKLAIIGVSPNPNDTHIWEPIKDASAKLLYIGSTSHFKVWASLSKDSKHLGRTFKQGFDSLIRELICETSGKKM